jgi:sugar lactone lactonase YvrE
MLAGDVLSLGADGAVERRHVGAVAAVVRPRTAGGAVIAVERGFLLEDADGSLTALPEVFTDPTLRMNEGGCDPEGRFYCGSMAYEQTAGAGTVYRLDPDLSVHEMWSGVTVSNGLEWVADGSRAYYNDTPTHQVSVFDYDPVGGLSGRRRFVDVVTGPDGGPEEPGNPDGLTVDAEGGVWTALFGAGAVHRYSPDGALDAVVEVGATQVTACTFGGADLDELWITTSREGLGPDDEPTAGAVFRASVGVRGMPVRPFAG